MLGDRSSVLMRGGVWRSLVVVATAGITSLGCVGGSPQPEQVPLAELVADHEAHDGSMVVTEGIVQTYDEPRHYWIEDVEQHRVELFPPERVEDLVGLRVRVTGRFTFRDDRGRGIDVDELEVVDEPREQAADLDDPLRVLAVGRVIEDKQVRIGKKRHSDTEPLLRPERIVLVPVAAALAETDEVQQLGDPTAAMAAQPREHPEVRLPRQCRTEAGASINAPTRWR